VRVLNPDYQRGTNENLEDEKSELWFSVLKLFGISNTEQV